MPLPRTMPAGDFAIGDDRTVTRPRRACIAPALHVPGDAIPQHVHDRATVMRRAEERQVALDAQLDVYTREALNTIREMSARFISDDQARDVFARELTTALMTVIRQPSDVGAALTAVHRALIARDVEPTTAAHFARVSIDALTAGNHIR